MGKIQNKATALRVSLLVHARDDLAVETPQQRLKLGTQQRRSALVVIKTGAEYLITLIAGQLFKESVKPRYAVGLAQHQVHRQLDPQNPMDVLQARPNLI